MAVSRTQISILSIYFTIGFMANNVCGDCYRPNFTNPYAILLNPDQSIYNHYYYIDLSCQEAHTSYGLPDGTYCGNTEQDTLWDPDPSDGRCEAQCNTAELLDDDILVKVNGTQQTFVDSRSIGDFSCRVPGLFTGETSAVCTNGTFAYTTEPSCLGFCPIYLQELGKGLLYDGGPDTPILGNSTVEYYEDQATIIYQCEDGYYDLNCSVHGLPDDCTTTCVDGTWTPSQIPICIDIDECLSSPCQNNATCHDLINKYECECPDGFNGTLCEINIDDCANHTCQNGATCVDEVAAYECQCPDGYDGTYCENDIDECSSNPCKNNATCTDLVNEFNCSCAPGYQGVLCDEVLTTSAMTTIIMTTDNTTSLGSTFEPVLTTTDQDMTTSELTTAMPLSTNMITDQTTMAVTSSKAVTTDKMTTLLGTTLPSTTLTTSTDSSTTSVTVVTTGTPAAATTIFSEATTVTPEATPVTSDMATISKGVTASPVPASTTESDSNTTSVMTTKTVGTTDTPTAATNITSDATTVTPDVTTVTSGMATISKGATAQTVPASTTESDSNTTSVMTTEVVATTDTPAAATTAITAATTVTPDATTNTADATTVSPGMTTISKETTAKSTKSSTEPWRTEKPPTTPLPCGGECLPTQVCNSMDQCECRPDYYEDEDDNEEPCKVPTSIDVTITITAVNGSEAVYKEEYANPESEQFKALEEDVCQPFNEIYRNEIDYEGCRVIEFTEGSIIVNYVLTFVENSTIGVSNVTETVYEELQNPNGSFSGELTFNDTSLRVAPLNECDEDRADCDINATCIDEGVNGYRCECIDGFKDVGESKNLLPGRECTKLPTTELPRITTEESDEPGMEVWKVVVGVTVPIVGILTISIVGLVCWQYRRLDRTSPVSESTKLRTRPYQEDVGDSDRDASRPGSMMIMNNDGTVQEVVLPWRNDSSEGEFIFAPDIDSKGKNQMLPMVDYPSNYGPSSYDNDPLGNIVSSYDNYTYQNHDTRNTTEIDSRYF